MGELQSENHVWYTNHEGLQVPARLVNQSEADGSYELQVLTKDSTGKYTFPQQITRMGAKEYSKLEKCHYSSVVNDCDNFESLSEFTPASVTFLLYRRYLSDQIYTYIGQILIAINPYKLLPSYTNTYIEKYDDPATSKDMPPHIYALTSWAYRDLKLNGKDQAILVSGESGAGKTESTKLVLQFLSETAGGASGVEQRLLRTNPILESFGNAKTSRNDNSSRFGKWLEISFDLSEDALITSARIEQYLLEKIRVVNQNKGERNYHIFYYLTASFPFFINNCKAKLKGTEKESLLDETESWKLDSAENFSYLGVNNSLPSDAQNFENLIMELYKNDFNTEELIDIFRVLALVLHIGNLDFSSCNDEGEASITQSSEISETIDTIVKLLGPAGGQEAFIRKMTTKEITVGTEVTYVPIKLEAAYNYRDTIAKSIYSRLFDFVVSKLNKSISPSSSTNTQGTNKIGLLDIFGFEIFERNSFEQLCINYANEKLQEVFNKYIFEENARIYIEEGLSVKLVPYKDNKPTIKSINSILTMLDDESKMPKGEDNNYALSLYNAYKVSSSGGDEKPIGIPMKNRKHFIVRHYAAPVEYSTYGFIEKNRDKLLESLEIMIAGSSTSQILRSKFNAKVDHKGKFQSINKQFRSSLNTLINKLNTMHIFYIKCVKPNTSKSVHLFEVDSVQSQLKNNGVFEAIEARRTGYGYNKSFVEFFNRYKQLLEENHKGVEKAESIEVEGLVNDLVSEGYINYIEDIKLGKTKVFYRHVVMELLEREYEKKWLEKVREEKKRREERLARERLEREKMEQEERDRLTMLEKQAEKQRVEMEEVRKKMKIEKQKKIEENKQVIIKEQKLQVTSDKPIEQDVVCGGPLKYENESLLYSEDEDDQVDPKLSEAASFFSSKQNPLFASHLSYVSRKLKKYPYLKTPEEYNGGSYSFTTEGALDNMIFHTKEVILKPLTKFEFEDDTTEQCFKSDSVLVFKNILGIMKDKTAAYPATLAAEVLKSSVREYKLKISLNNTINTYINEIQVNKNQLLIEEIFAQLIKQTSKNPDENSNLLGWKMIYLCVNSFTPLTIDMLFCLGNHCANNAMGSSVRSRSDGLGQISDLAATCLFKLRALFKNKKFDQDNLQLKDIEKIVDIDAEPVTVFNVDGRAINICIEKNDPMNLHQFVKHVCLRIYLPAEQHRKFYIKVMVNISDPELNAMIKSPDPNAKALEFFSKIKKIINDYNLKTSENKKAKYAIVLYKRFYTVDDRELEKMTPSYIRCSYFSAHNIVRKGQLIKLDMDTLTQLAAIQLIIMSRGQIIESTNQISDKILAVLMPAYSIKFSNYDKIQTVKDKIFENIKKHNGTNLTPVKCHTNYLEIVKKKASYGLNVFMVVKIEAPKELLDIHSEQEFSLALNWNVLTIFGKKNEKLLSTRISDIKNFKLYMKTNRLEFEIKGLTAKMELYKWDVKIAYKLLRSMIKFSVDRKKQM
eukprot:GAHX01000573.1.p1 GENE.GAHX01000573.1~~GAHX01000573.1.p1  ORF type:complete len:1472 (-),score=344.41 GAHX01000573.1:39-4454(-)